MITFKSFLNESSPSPMSVSLGLTEIAQHCKPFLREASMMRPLFRGFHWSGSTSNTILHVPHPSERTAKDSDPGFNSVFNTAIEDRFNIPSVRTRSVFVTGSSIIARGYGSICYFFPKGEYKYLWSPVITDSYEDYSKFLIEGIDDFEAAHNASKTILTSGLAIRLLNSLVEEVLPKGASIFAPLSDSQEKAFNDVVSFYVNSSVEAALKKTNMTIHEALVDIVKRATVIAYKNSTKLRDAAASNNEILFYQTDGYYMVPVQSYMDFAKLGSSGTIASAYEHLLGRL